MGDWDMHTTCGAQCPVCDDRCDRMVGHEEACDFSNHRQHQREKRALTAAVLTRPSWPATWMQVAKTVALRSYDPRLKVGAIVVTFDNTQMMAVGYNGNYKGGPHEHESPEPGQSGFIHAEVNCLVKCDFSHWKPKHMYLTHSPCRDCAKLIINAGISRVVYETEYRDTSGMDLLRSAGIEVYSIAQAILMAEDEDAKGR